MRRIVDRADLFCKAGSKDAVYFIQLEEVDGGHVVNYQNGRAGGTLTHGTKTQKGPVDLAAARKIFDKVVREKLTASPPYKPMDGQGGSFTEVSLAVQDRATGLSPQLLNDIDYDDPQALERYINDPSYVGQQKVDGERRMARRASAMAVVIGSNRKAEQVPLPVRIAESMNGVVCTIDAEIIGEHLYAFDLLELDGVDLRGMAYRVRKERLDGLQGQLGANITVLKDAFTPEEKRVLWERTRAMGQEGAVFKDLTATYTEGRPNSGGPQIKVKHWKDTTVVVLGAKEDKRSVHIGVLDGHGSMIEVGAVTIPPNAQVPAENDLIDVRYLYAYEGGSLFQPTFKRKRTDLSRSDAALSRLYFKKAHVSVDVTPDRLVA